jgi:hypothetical protein
MTELVYSTIPSAQIEIPASSMFTYPTRLSDTWMPAIQRVLLPQLQVRRPEIKFIGRSRSISTAGTSASNLIGSAFKRALQKVRPSIDIGSDYLFDARYDTDSNVAHVLCNIASMVLAIRNECPGIRVILRSNATSMARSVFALLKLSTLCTDKSVVGNVVIPRLATGERFEGHLYSESFTGASFEYYIPDTPKKIFISRRGARYLINEDQVEQFLKPFGFKKIYFEDIPLNQQWSLAKNASAIVGIHGAALSSILFNTNAVKLIELFHPGYVVNGYRIIVSSVGGTWCGVSGQYPPDIIRRLDYEKKTRYFALEPLRVDITSLEMAIDYLGLGLSAC